MPHFKCLACKTRLHRAEREADFIGHLCPVCGSLLEPVGDLGEIVGDRVVETRGGTSHRGASRARVIAGRVGEIIARRELKHARVRAEIERCDADSVSRRAQAVSSRASGSGDKSRETPPRSHRQPRRRAPSELSMEGLIGATGQATRESALRCRSRFGWRAMKWDRRRDTIRRQRRSAAPARASRSTCSWSAGHALT